MVRIVSADAWVLEKLQAGTFSASVHSHFKHTVNMICSQTGTLCSLVHNRGDSGPGALVTDAPDFSNLPLVQDMPVTTANGCLHLGGVRLVFTGARAWDAPVFPVSITRPVLAANLRAVATASALAHRQGNVPRARLHALLAGPAISAGYSPLDCETHRLLTSRTEAMTRALANSDVPLACENASGLLGLGQGLTPSGDDILLGFLAACSVYAGSCAPELSAPSFSSAPSVPFVPSSPSVSGSGPHPACLATLSAHIVAKAQRATHILSWAGIAEAARGRMRTTLSAFILALLAEDRQDIEQRLASLLAIGSCSGADLAYGIIRGLEACFGGQVPFAADPDDKYRMGD